MQKKHLVLGSLISTLALTACNSGGSTTPNSNNVSSVNTTTKLPIIVGESNQRLFDVNYDDNKNSKTLTNAHTTKFISLRPLTKEQATDADKIGLEALHQLHATSLNSDSSSTFKASQRVIDTPEFFDGHQEVLDQGAFGSCVTFATDAALSYVSTGTSNNIAPCNGLIFL